MTIRGPATGRPAPELTEKDIARFWAKVNKTDFHWLWTAGVNNRRYPVFGMADSRCFLAHRISLQIAGIEIPAGLVVDHMCREPLCVNPAHLRIVTPTINTIENSVGFAAVNRQKTHCLRGHEFNAANTTYTKHGRMCRACRRKGARESPARRMQRTNVL